MRTTRRALTTALIAIFAIGIATSTAAALKPVWEYGTTTNKHLLKTGETKTTTLTGGKYTAVLPTFPGNVLTVTCQKSSGTGSVIGGEPGKGKVTMTFSECEGRGNMNQCKLSVFKLENIATELVVLKDGKTIAESLTFPLGSPTSWIKIEGEEFQCASLPRGTYKITGAIPGLVGGGESLEFPKTPVEGFKVTVTGELALEEYKDTFSQKLTSGETLFAELH